MANVTPFRALNSIDKQLSRDEQDSIALVLKMLEKLQALPVAHQKTAMDMLTTLRDVQPEIRDDFLNLWCRERSVDR